MCDEVAPLNRIERKYERIFLVLPFLWYALVSTRPIGRWISANAVGSQFSITEGSPGDRLFFTILIFLGVIVLLHRRFPWIETMKRNKWLCLLMFYALVSIAWSSFPDIALKRWIKLFGSAIMASIVLSDPAPGIAISSVLRTCFLIHIPLDVIFVKYFRSLGVAWDDWGVEMWTGLTTHKNVLGQVCMTAGVYFFWDLIQRPSKVRMAVNILWLSTLVYLMNGPGYSRSATSMFSLFVGILVLVWLEYAPRDPRLLTRYFVKGGCAILLVFFIFQLGVLLFTEATSVSEVAMQVSGRNSTLTGRTDLWKDTVEFASKNPLTGVGYGSFWIGDVANDLWDKYFWKPTQAHNGYIDVYVELGLFGLLIFSGVLVSAFGKLKNNIAANFQDGCFQMTLFIMIIIHNISETSFLRGDVDLWFAFLLVTLDIRPIS